MNKRRAFTLIELLVVIAIIALLVAILLPALGKARKAALMAGSMSNLHQLNIASGSYRHDFKGFMPITLTYQRGIAASSGTPLEGWCTWQFGGKNCQSRWGGIVFDVEAADRPLNPYMYHDAVLEAPAIPGLLPPNAPERLMLQLPGYYDPSDKIGHQGAGNPNGWPNPNTDGSTCYDDVGTSYQFNVKWWEQIPASLGFIRRFNAGAAREALADTYEPDRFVWLHDEYSDILCNQSDPNYRIVNGYGDINKSLHAYMDGHARYNIIYPGVWDPRQPGGGRAFTNSVYTFVFTALRPQ